MFPRGDARVRSVDLLLHPPDDPGRHQPDPRGRLSSVGHGAAFRAFAQAARRAGIQFMVIGGTFRDVAIRAASTRDIDIVLIDRRTLPNELMEDAGFTRIAGSRHAWRYTSRGHLVDLEVAAIASSENPSGPFSIAVQHARRITIEGIKAAAPQIEDYVILKLLAAAADHRRRARDLVDVQFVLEAEPANPALSIAVLRARLRDVYGIAGQQLKDLVGMLREVARRLK